MDQLCIDQFNNEEQNQEVPKMRQYYSNSIATLVAINTKTNDDTNKENKKDLATNSLKKIVSSQ